MLHIQYIFMYEKHSCNFEKNIFFWMGLGREQGTAVGTPNAILCTVHTVPVESVGVLPYYGNVSWYTFVYLHRLSSEAYYETKPTLA